MRLIAGVPWEGPNDSIAVKNSDYTAFGHCILETFKDKAKMHTAYNDLFPAILNDFLSRPFMALTTVVTTENLLVK